MLDSTGYDVDKGLDIGTSFSRFLGLSQIDNDANWEGFSYLGLGLLVGCSVGFILTLYNSIRSPYALLRNLRSRAFVIIGIILMLIISITHEIRFGHEVFYLADRINIPKSLVEHMVIFRASARFAWPFIYIVCIFFIGRMLAAFESKFVLIRSLGIILMAFLAVLQISDLADGHKKLRDSFVKRSPGSHELADLRRVIKQQEVEVVKILGSNIPHYQYLWVARAALSENIPTNVIYSAKQKKVFAKQGFPIKQNQGERNTLYVLPTSIHGSLPDFLNCEEYVKATDFQCHEISKKGVALLWRAPIERK